MGSMTRTNPFRSLTTKEAREIAAQMAETLGPCFEGELMYARDCANNVMQALVGGSVGDVFVCVMDAVDRREGVVQGEDIARATAVYIDAVTKPDDGFHRAVMLVHSGVPAMCLSACGGAS